MPQVRLVRLIGAALEAAGAPRPASLGLILSDDRELARLNRQAMGRAGPTDVLSFPLLAPSAFPPHAGQEPTTDDQAGSGSGPAFVLPPGRRIHLGDLVISVERAVEQAAQGRGGQTGDHGGIPGGIGDGGTRDAWSAADELCLLAVHGALHICGWDHARPAERDAMRAEERQLLARARR
ncbi:MAG: rRNA maturation RNase YbeY [Candidatus Limnocylindrales bacterium]